VDEFNQIIEISLERKFCVPLYIFITGVFLTSQLVRSVLLSLPDAITLGSHLILSLSLRVYIQSEPFLFGSQSL
jgi:hypothetical protein